MEYNNELCRDLINLIVETYKESCEDCIKNKKRISYVGIDFMEIFSSDDVSIQFGERFNELVIKASGKPLNSRSKVLRRRIIKASNVCKLIFTDILQVINLLQKLEKENLIILSNRDNSTRYPNFDKDEENNVSYININNYKIEEYIKENYYSQIIPTTTLIDIAENDFKTVEQRRFEKQLKVADDTLVETKRTLIKTRHTFYATIAALIVSIISGFYQSCSQQEIDSEQINTIISAIKEQKSISIDKFPDIIPDTLNVRVTDASDKQPINLNVTVKENQPAKVQ